MKKSQIRNRNRISRKPALSSIGMAVVATLIAGGVHAADTSYSFEFEPAVANAPAVNASGHQTQKLLLNNGGPVTATLQNGQGNISASGAQTANSTFLTGNTMGASAIGNVALPVDTSIDLILISDTAGGNTGLATLLHSTNTGAVSSLVEDNSLSIVLTGFESGSAVNKDNTISASTVVNQGTSSIAGVVPVGYTSVTPGSVSVSSLFGPVESAAQGSIVVTTAQQTSDVASSAVAADNAVALTLTAGNMAALEAGAAVTGNKIVASTKGNSSASTIDIQSVEGAPTFSGSAVISNTQLGTNAPASATNSDGSVRATVTGLLGISELGGSLAVSGNSISSATIGNEALGSGTNPVGNQILLADGLSFAGPGNISAPPGATLNGYADGTAVNADLVIANTQSNTSLLGSVMGSSTINGAVETSVESLVNGAVALSDNAITSSATGNAARSALASGTNAASFSGSAALANQQDNTTVGVTATNAGSSIEATAGSVQDSSVSVADNRSSASARGNEVGQSLDLNATTLSLGDTVNLTSSATLLQASGPATVSNRQVNTGAAVTANNTASSIGQRATSVSGPTLSVTGNTQDAVALANNASNQLSLAGTTVSGGAGILSQQRVDAEEADYTPASTVTATLSGARAFIEAGNGASVAGSTLAVTDNLQEAIGYGNLVNNAMSVSGTTLVTPDTLGAASTVTLDSVDNMPSGNVVAAFGVLSQQSVLSDVNARVTSSGASAQIAVTGSLDNSTALNDANTLSTEAYGNYGQSGLSLAATNVGVGAFSSVGNLTSLQSVEADITAQTATGAVALTSVSGNVGSVDTVSSVSASGNRIDAQATGSRAINTVGVSATNIDTVATGSTSTAMGSEMTTTAAFSLQNMQTGAGSVNATLLDVDNTSLPSDVRVAIVGDVTRSSVLADGNTARAVATSNNATNALLIDGSGNLATSSAQQNVQVTSAGVNALVGQAGLPASAGGPFNYGIGGTGLSHDSETDMFTAGTLTVDTTALGADARAFLLNNGWSDAGANMVSRSAVGYSATVVDYLDLTMGGTFARSGITLPTDGTPNSGGVNLAVGGSVTDSALSVSGNTTYGLTRGNVASNRTEVKGNTIASGSSATVASAGEGIMGGLETVADHTVTNLQQVIGDAPINSNVHGSFFISAQPGAAISGSSLSVSGNTQMAEARANTATNSLMLEGTSVTAVSALQSAQMSAAAVNASSNLNLFAPGAVTDSSVLLSNNSNIALAVMNDATNSLTVQGSQVGSGDVANISVGGDFGDTLTAEHVLANQQAATTTVTSTATTTLNNQEALASDTGTAVRSTLSILDNTTAAEATANQALNTASVTGTASQAASVALRNIQDSSADVTATATSAARVALAPLNSTALNSSSVVLDGNSTTALARGNSATNVLNSLAGANYGPATGGSVQSGDALTGFAVNANAGILNSQSNTGAVSAASTGASYQVAMNSMDAAALSSSSLAVTGNQVVAQAYGNSAVNQLTLNASNTGTPTSAIGNYQRNTGAITATVTSVNFGAGISNAMTGSTVNVSGNQISASAVGNSVASSIMAAPR
ncbi:MAG: hypothetical protein CVU22_04780 [Betaproteobacteria bacterium HGW-Betaproteobacteria-16]|nr:MAG: hypothetical protein CVU22_04780 [Betaproteobacteria bacterium HGW-Betaproteobacteria-16]